jgi:hypothetical protein
MPLQSARQEQPGNVGAGDEKQERHRTEQRHEESPAVAIEDVLHRRRGGTDALKRRIRLRQSTGDRGDFGLRRRKRRPVAQARECVSGTVGRARFVWRHAEPEVDVRVQVVVGLARGARIREEPDSSRHHADDRERRWHPAHADRAPDDVGIAAERTLPKVVTQDDGRRRRVGTSELPVGELPAEDRPEPEHAEVIRRDDHPAHRLAAVGQHEKVEGPPIDRG